MPKNIAKFLMVLLTYPSIGLTQTLEALPLTPAERYQLGDRNGGIHLIADPSACSHQAAAKFINTDRIIKPLDMIYGIDPSGPRVAQIYNLEIQSTLTRTLEALTKQNYDIQDPAASHSVCVGLYRYDEFNARSYSAGYILTDPEVIRQMYTFPGRSMLSIDQVYLHEFAHQLQYWNGNPFTNDRTSRRTELAADCIGAGLLAVTWEGLDDEILKIEGLGMIHSAELVGDDDVNNPDHHGTPLERKAAVQAGLDIVKKSRTSLSLRPWSTRIQNACNDKFK